MRINLRRRVMRRDHDRLRQRDHMRRVGTEDTPQIELARCSLAELITDGGEANTIISASLLKSVREQK
jgi:hypothetical protein